MTQAPPATPATAPSREPHHVDAPLAPPSPEAGLAGVFARRYLLRLLVRREISARYQGSLLGLLWSYINPLSQLFIFYVIMGEIVGLGDRVPNFGIHVFAGLIIVHFFTETIGAGTRSIVRNKSLVQKMAVPREMFPVASMLTSLYHVFPQVIIILGTCLIVGWHPDLTGIAAGALALAIIIVLGTSLALVLSCANVFFRDVGSVVAIMTNFVRFSVPMIYPFTKVAERFDGHVAIYLANPIADAVLLFQRCFWVTTADGRQRATLERTNFPPHLFERGLIALAISVVLLGVAQLIFRRWENRIPERLS